MEELNLHRECILEKLLLTLMIVLCLKSKCCAAVLRACRPVLFLVQVALAEGTLPMSSGAAAAPSVIEIILCLACAESSSS